jgi:pyrroloquinoline quinone (PQQ) biosynthesis protein C
MTISVRRYFMAKDAVIARLDAVVDDFSRRVRYFQEPMTQSRARMFVKQHRLNTRQRNSVLKLKVATNCPDWETRLRIIGACSEEIIADHEHGHGKPHWAILEELGTYIGMTRAEIRAAQPVDTTAIAWAAWEGLMANRHWLEGIVANTCAERANVPGYGTGIMRRKGWFGLERARWGKLFGLSGESLDFFELHEAADIAHSDMGWNTIARFARELRMEDAAVEACRKNLLVWEMYLNGIAAAGDAEEKGGGRRKRK